MDHFVSEFMDFLNIKHGHTEPAHLLPIRKAANEVASFTRNKIEIRQYLGGLVPSFERHAAILHSQHAANSIATDRSNESFFPMIQSTDNLVATVTHALRHKPEQYLLMVSAEGWTDLESLVMALRCRRREWSKLSCADLRQWVQAMSVRRFELRGDQIRALYGHSLEHVVVGDQRKPPEVLWHGTISGALDSIRQNGLLPMGRKLVHLTSDQKYAGDVADSKGNTAFRDEVEMPDADPSGGPTLILTVRAVEAFDAGVQFWQANDHVWLADPIPAQFVEWPKCD